MHAGCVEAVFSSTDQMSDNGKVTVQQLQAQPLGDNVCVRVQQQMHAAPTPPNLLLRIRGAATAGGAADTHAALTAQVRRAYTLIVSVAARLL